MNARTGLVAAAVVAMTAAGTALALAGWEPAAIIGLLTAVATLTAPLITLVLRTEQVHKIVNSQRSGDTAYRKQLADTLRAHNIVVPDDATGQHD